MVDRFEHRRAPVIHRVVVGQGDDVDATRGERVDECRRRQEHELFALGHPRAVCDRGLEIHRSQVGSPEVVSHLRDRAATPIEETPDPTLAVDVTCKREANPALSLHDPISGCPATDDRDGVATVRGSASERAVKGCIAEGEDATIASRQPIPLSRRRGRNRESPNVCAAVFSPAEATAAGRIGPSVAVAVRVRTTEARATIRDRPVSIDGQRKPRVSRRLYAPLRVVRSEPTSSSHTSIRFPPRCLLR